MLGLTFIRIAWICICIADYDSMPRASNGVIVGPESGLCWRARSAEIFELNMFGTN